MPTFTGTLITPDWESSGVPSRVVADPLKLFAQGPRLPGRVGILEAAVPVYEAKGWPVPEPIMGAMIVDTGASHTCICKPFLDRLQAAQLASSEMLTPGGKAATGVYACSLSFPGTALPPILNAEVRAIDDMGDGVLGLLGRDVLVGAVVVYNGPASTWSISF